MDTGNASWLLTSSALVLLMTPGLAFFYGGLVRKKNAAATIMHSLITIGIVGVVWVIWGYALAFGKDIGGIIGWSGFALNGISPDIGADADNYTDSQLFMIFQGMFAIITPALIIMGIGTILSWEKVDSKKNIQQIITSILFTILIILIFFLFYRAFNILGFVGIALGSWIICNVFVKIFINIKKEKNKKILFSAKFLKHFNSMTVAHLGVGLLILGITGSSVWQKENITRMKVNDETTINNYNVVFKEINKIKGPNYVALEGNFWVYDQQNKIVTVLKPEKRIYPITNQTTTEVSIHTNLLRDLYIVLGDEDILDGWIVRIYYNPLVIWIWIGVLFIFTGGLFSLKNNLKILRRYN